MTLFASTAQGLEELLKNELQQLGAVECKIVQGGVEYQGDESVMYRTLLWSRLASRIYLPLRTFNVYSDLDLYSGALSVAWSDIFDVTQTFSVSFTGSNEEIRHTQFGALRIKDAIVDYFLRRTNERPNVEKQMADIRVHAYLHKNQATLFLDLSGEGLHQRGYRQGAGSAPLKENLAAAIVLRSGWKKSMPLIDPMCGSGTLLIEAALMATDRAPGLTRHYWGFNGWKQHNVALWQRIVDEAKQRAAAVDKTSVCEFIGYDLDRRVIETARHNARTAGVADFVHFMTRPIVDFTNPLPEKTGVILSNPPYGERLDSEAALIALYNTLGTRAKQYFPGWQLSLFSASPELLSCLQLRSSRQFKAKNGPLACVQKNYSISAYHNQQTGENSENGLPSPVMIASDFANRLKKNLQKLEKWAKQENITCYRLYDADLPEYNVAIDRYNDYIVIQEYAAPKTIDPQKARQRVFDVIQATLTVLQLPDNKLILKQRARQKGKQQYEKLAQKRQFLLAEEYHAKFRINLTDYLDTGLFLDHRITRKMIGEMSQNKDFLNLFAYTGTASVYAGLGGARSTTTVDMSNTYLDWAKNNMHENNLYGREHRFIQQDCLAYIKESHELFDLIFVDPPTFSNSKRMEETFDIQRDHVMLLAQVKRLLRDNGVIVFSNNKQGFKLDEQALKDAGLIAKEITAKTQSPDFSRRHLHHCWLIEHI